VSEIYPTLSEIRETILAGKTSCESRLNEYLKRIEDHKDLNAFVELFPESALKRAREIDQKVKEREFWIKLPDNQINRAFRVDLSRLKQKIKSPKAHE
jgi:Asp-tRNA(Asn)/Glu-tRNA(Gln) amidotransferase A subunit family amidase